MSPGEHAPDPREARTPAEFLARLQALKDWSGLTYRDLSARAEARGDVLPRSTVADMLARATLPREELLTVFVRACGAPPAELAHWRTTRRRLAGVRGEGEAGADPEDGVSPDAGAGAGAAPGAGRGGTDTGAPGPSASPEASGVPDASDGPRPPDAPWPSDGPLPPDVPGPDHRPPSPVWPVGPDPQGSPDPAPSRIRRALVAVVAVAGLVLAGVSVVAFLRDGRTGPAGQPPRTPVASASAPAAGDVRIRVTGTGLCLGERRGTRTGQVHQVPCAEPGVPLYSLVAVGAGRWRIASDHPDLGPGCSGIPSGGRVPGAAYEDSECGDPSRVETFALEPYGRPVRGHRIVPVGSATPGSCVTVTGDRDAAWAPLAQAPCAPDAAGQLFTFERRD
ncbi:helix-turn-helix domain-containing protein [Streptomyces sp. NPDC001728]|uniref:helix-turn-helix domain-containing protein n=1 Tax=Streptomyces sp. NPDC001728 TaxID=3154396 RepID=UPI003321D7AA